MVYFLEKLLDIPDIPQIVGAMHCVYIYHPSTTFDNYSV